MDRGYPNLLLDSAIERARQIPRKVALRRVNREKKTKGPITECHYILYLYLSE